ncbi:MAG: WYL domain-containing protein [Dehalococcoidia bacterium]|nr:WYL domain-containing protein [Dehalococcoidia bacterium]
MTTPQRRSVRLIELRDLFERRGSGYTSAELARLTGVSLRSIQRDLLVLETESGVPLAEERGRYFLPTEERLTPMRLNLQEARALLLATRLFLRYSDEGDPYAASALRQLAEVMPEAVRQQAKAAAESLARRPLDADFTRNLRVISEAWAKRRSLRLSYRSAGKQRAREVIVDPYFLEPSAAGFSTYLIGHSHTHGGMRTFKVERVVTAEMLPRAFELPADLDVDTLLSSAWGIIWGEGHVVKLRFSPAAAWRAKESRWHPSQEIIDTDDGGCLLTIRVASLLEVGRWVRGWGDEVEVLAPEELRDELRREAVRLARLYARPPATPARKRARRPAPEPALPPARLIEAPPDGRGPRRAG